MFWLFTIIHLRIAKELNRWRLTDILDEFVQSLAICSLGNLFAHLFELLILGLWLFKVIISSTWYLQQLSFASWQSIGMNFART